MRRSLALAILGPGLLLLPSLAAAQELVSSPVPLSAKVQYSVATQADTKLTPRVFVDDTPFAVIAKVCGPEEANPICVVTPEPAFFVAMNTPPFPHRLDADLGNGTATSPRASEIRVTPPQPPAPTHCAYVDLAGVAKPKPIGNDDVRGWNPIDTTNIVAVREFYARLKQLRAWGLDASPLVIDDGLHVAVGADGKPVHPVTGKPWAFIYAPCVGPPQ
jgi:hypothetical protein